MNGNLDVCASNKIRMLYGGKVGDALCIFFIHVSSAETLPIHSKYFYDG
jgi:hypothetical protein